MLSTEPTERLEMLRGVLWSLQRMRSISKENLGDDETVLAYLQPWAFGPKSILPTIQKLVAAAEQTGEDVPVNDFFNILCVCRTLDEGNLGRQIDVGLAFADIPLLPDDPMEWLKQQRPPREI